MRVLLIHNRYIQKGGEDVVFSLEKNLLKENGCEVISWSVSNKILLQRPKFWAVLNAIWSVCYAQKLERIIAKYRPDIIHFHNVFLTFSPSLYWVAKRFNVPVIQTLHNYRLICPSGILMKDGKVCEKCVGKFFPIASVWHRCWRNEFLESFLMFLIITIHKLIGTWRNKIDLYIALTEFARKKFIEGGLPEGKLVVKPNFIPDIGEGSHNGRYFLFVGRLSEEKGIDVLCDAVRILAKSGDMSIKVKVAGDGPMFNYVKQVAEKTGMLDVLGWVREKEVASLMKSSFALIMPSKWYEGFPMILLYAMASGLPIIASNIGAMKDVISDGADGLLFERGNAKDLADKMRQLYSLRGGRINKMRKNVRRKYVEHYTPEENYNMLMRIYRLAIQICNR